MSKLRSVKADSGAVPELHLFEAIGEGMATIREVSLFLQANAEAPVVIVRISSTGGDAFEGIAIHEALSGFKGTVKTIGSGVVASAAAIAFLGGSIRQVSENCSLMVHNSHGEATGGAKEMASSSKALADVDAMMANIIRKVTGQPTDTIQRWMASEQWFSPQEAVEARLATEVIGNVYASVRQDLSHFRHVPKGVAQRRDMAAANARPRSIAEAIALGNARAKTPPTARSSVKPKCLTDVIRHLNQGR